MKKLLILLVNIMAFHGKIFSAVDDVSSKRKTVYPSYAPPSLPVTAASSSDKGEPQLSKQAYKPLSKRPAPPTRAAPEPPIDPEVDKLLMDLDQMEKDFKKMDYTDDERKALDEAKAQDERMKAKWDALGKEEIRGIRIIESTAPQSARLSFDQEEALRKEGSITSPEEAKAILDKEARNAVNWGDKNSNITNKEDQKRIKEKYDREQKALNEVTQSKNSTIKLDKAHDSLVEYKSVKSQIANYEINKKMGRYMPAEQAQIEAEHKGLSRDIKLYNQTAQKRRALEKEQKILEKTLAKRKTALDDWNKLSSEEKKDEKRIAAQMGFDDPEDEAKVKVKSAQRRLNNNQVRLKNEVNRAQTIEGRINQSTAQLFRSKAPIKLEEKPVVKKKAPLKKISIFETVKSKVMPSKKMVPAVKEVDPVVNKRTSVHKGPKARPAKSTVKAASTKKPSMMKRVFSGK